MQRLYNCLVSFLVTDIEDDEDWYRRNEEDEGLGQGDLYDVGQECLDRIAIALARTRCYRCARPPCRPSSVTPMEERHAALIALSQIAEGCAKGMKDVVSAIQPYLRPPRTAAAASSWPPSTTWQMCTDLGPRLQKRRMRTCCCS